MPSRAWLWNVHTRRGAARHWWRWIQCERSFGIPRQGRKNQGLENEGPAKNVVGEIASQVAVNGRNVYLSGVAKILSIHFIHSFIHSFKWKRPSNSVNSAFCLTTTPNVRQLAFTFVVYIGQLAVLTHVHNDYVSFVYFIRLGYLCPFCDLLFIL